MENVKSTFTVIDFSKNVKVSVNKDDLSDLGWDFDMPTQEHEGGQRLEDEDKYHIDITVNDNGETSWCFTNTEKEQQGIWEGSDKEATGDDEGTIKDLEKLYSEGKLWGIRTEYYGA